MILRRRITRRVPSGVIRVRASSQPPCSARSTNSLVTTLRESSRGSGSGRTPTQRPARVLGGSAHQASPETSSSASINSTGSGVVEREGGLELGGGAGADDRRGDSRAVADPGECHLQRRPAEPVGGPGDRLDDLRRAPR